MKAGDEIEYAAHPVAWQDDGTPLPYEDEDWRAATVLDVFEHPVQPPDTEPDVVVRLRPDDGSPPFDLTVKLIRSA